ncbi:MAG: hypothetical protein D6705_13510, partial [Deltaproteobacteria bacterium]
MNVRSRILLLGSCALTIGVACGAASQAALESDTCKAYFAKVDACVSAVGGTKAKAWRMQAETVREGLGKGGESGRDRDGMVDDARVPG